MPCSRAPYDVVRAVADHHHLVVGGRPSRLQHLVDHQRLRRAATRPRSSPPIVVEVLGQAEVLDDRDGVVLGLAGGDRQPARRPRCSAAQHVARCPAYGAVSNIAPPRVVLAVGVDHRPDRCSPIERRQRLVERRAEQRALGARVERRQPVRGERVPQRGQDAGRRVGQRAVEVEQHDARTGSARRQRLQAGDLGVVEQPARDDALEPRVDRREPPASPCSAKFAQRMPELLARHGALEGAHRPAEPRRQQLGRRDPHVGGPGPPAQRARARPGTKVCRSTTASSAAAREDSSSSGCGRRQPASRGSRVARVAAHQVNRDSRRATIVAVPGGLAGEDEPAAGLEHPQDLAERQLDVGDVVQHRVPDDEVELSSS